MNQLKAGPNSRPKLSAGGGDEGNKTGKDQQNGGPAFKRMNSFNGGREKSFSKFYIKWLKKKTDHCDKNKGLSVFY